LLATCCARPSTPWAPWIIVEGTDDRYRSLTVGKTILEALQKRLADKREPNSPVASPLSPRIDRLDVLSSLDISQSLPKDVYSRPSLPPGRGAWPN
jgi:hypothetical protein